MDCSFLLVALAVGGYLYAQRSKAEGPTAPAVTQAEGQASAAVAATNFQSVGLVLQARFTEHATYAGATVSPGSGVVLVRADPTSYCLQTEAGAAVAHETGPGGLPQPGPC